MRARGGTLSQDHRAVRRDDDLQVVSQSAALQFQHGLLLGIGVETGAHLVNQNQAVAEGGDGP